MLVQRLPRRANICPRAHLVHRSGETLDDVGDGIAGELVENADADLNRFGQGRPDAEAAGATAAPVTDVPVTDAPQGSEKIPAAAQD